MVICYRSYRKLIHIFILSVIFLSGCISGGGFDFANCFLLTGFLPWLQFSPGSVNSNLSLYHSKPRISKDFPFLCSRVFPTLWFHSPIHTSVYILFIESTLVKLHQSNMFSDETVKYTFFLSLLVL